MRIDYILNRKVSVCMKISNILNDKHISPSIQDPVFKSWIAVLEDNPPCGEDISFSNIFESLKFEVEKEVSLHGGQSTDWNLVLRMVTNILSKQSKDLWVICYGIIAANEVHGLVSCAAAISTLTSLLHSYWGEIYPSPSRMQRRIAPLQWLASRLENRISAAVYSDEKVAIAAIAKEILQLQSFLDAKIGNKAPSFANIHRMLGAGGDKGARDLPAASEPNNPHQASTAKVQPPPPVASAHSDVLSALESDGRVPSAVLPRLLRTTQDQCRQLATHYASCDPLDWRVTLLHRAALWCTINQLPKADASGITQLRSVPLDKAQTYSAAVENKRYLEILPQLESSAGQAPFWFDGHYLVARCLEGLEASASLALLRTILAQFLNSFPELTRYKFQDGTPFATPRTLQWLETLQDASFPNPALQRIPHGTGEAVREQELLAEGLAIRAEKGFQAGLSHLGGIPAGRSRAAIRQGLLRARYCIAAGNKKAALRLLHALYAQLEKWELLEWEPELSASIISLLISMQPKERGPAAEAMLSRLHWLHLGTAVGNFKEL
jgi:type VI secretion system protein VasJ